MVVNLLIFKPLTSFSRALLNGNPGQPEKKFGMFSYHDRVFSKKNLHLRNEVLSIDTMATVLPIS